MNRKGFTLIELLIVVVIIGILAAIAIPKFANTKEKAYVAAEKSDLRNLVTAEEAYFADHTTYTTTIGGTSRKTPTGPCEAAIIVTSWMQHYHTSLPGALQPTCPPRQAGAAWAMTAGDRNTPPPRRRSAGRPAGSR